MLYYLAIVIILLSRIYHSVMYMHYTCFMLVIHCINNDLPTLASVPVGFLGGGLLGVATQFPCQAVSFTKVGCLSWRETSIYTKGLFPVSVNIVLVIMQCLAYH